jgi:hypothetical protein
MDLNAAPAMPLNPQRPALPLQPETIKAYQLERSNGFKLGDKP